MTSHQSLGQNAGAMRLWHCIMVARQQETNLLEPAASGFQALPAFDLYKLLTRKANKPALHLFLREGELVDGIAKPPSRRGKAFQQ